MYYRFFPAIFLLILFSACGQDPKTLTVSDSLNKKDSLDTAKQAHVYALPAPLQVATAIKLDCPKYETGYLRPAGKSDFTSDYFRGLNLGAVLASAGHCAVYNDYDKTSAYIRDAKTLMDKLTISSAISNDIITRAKNNSSSPDSVSYILLQGYSRMSDYFKTNKRESAGFFIMSGVYIEGLWMTLSNKQFRSSKNFSQLLGQQKLWLTNLVEAMTYLDVNTDTQNLFNTLYTLQQEFLVIRVETNKGTVSASFTDNQLKKILSKTEQLRNEIMKG